MRRLLLNNRVILFNYKEEDKNMDLQIVCPFCGKTTTITLVGDEVARYKKWRNKELLIQEAFPDWPVDKREHLVSGICPACWDATFNIEYTHDQ